MRTCRSGALAARGIASLGADVVLDQLLVLARDASELNRNAAVRTLALLLDPSINRVSVTPATMQKITVAFTRAVQDENRFVRISAVEGFAVDSPETTDLLQSVAHRTRSNRSLKTAALCIRFEMPREEL